MIEYLNRYTELLTELEEERRILKNLEDIAEESQKEFSNNENNIIKLNQAIENIKKHMNEIINLKLQKNKALIFNNKVNNRINYNNQKHKILELEKQINEIKIDYATPIFDEELNRLSDNKPLTRVRSPQNKN